MDEHQVRKKDADSKGGRAGQAIGNVAQGGLGPGLLFVSRKEERGDSMERIEPSIQSLLKQGQTPAIQQ